MHRETNLYHNLVKNEDTLTELLVNLLQFPAVRQTFAQLLADKLKWADLSFQYAYKSRECGDNRAFKALHN